MRRLAIELTPALLATALFLTGGCGDTHNDPNAGAPPPLKVERANNANVFQVERPDQFPLTSAVERISTSQLRATATITPDISKSVPVVALATGRVVEIKARLGDTVQKGQVLLRIESADLAGAFSDYRKAVADEQLAGAQLARAKDLNGRGAISLNDLQVAQDTDDKARVDLENTTEHIHVLGGDITNPNSIVDI